jgi:recombination protein RecT
MANTQLQKPKFSVAIKTDAFQRLINDTLVDKKTREQFISAIMSAVANNPKLQECDPLSIISGGLLFASLGLSPSPQLGQAYLAPFKDNKNNRIVATPIIGYRGLLNLAIRSGQYRRITVMPIKRGELIKYDPLREHIEVRMIEDDLQREATEAIGYYGEFELVNGFRKALYWSREKMEAHADRYSKAYSLAADKKMKDGLIPEKDRWKYSSFWYTNFSAMACKTILRQLISKWGVMSIDMQTALHADEMIPTTGGEYIGAPGAQDYEQLSSIPEGYIVDESTGELVEKMPPVQDNPDAIPAQNSEPDSTPASVDFDAL